MFLNAYFLEIYQYNPVCNVILNRVHVESKDFILPCLPDPHCKYDTFLLHSFTAEEKNTAFVNMAMYLLSNALENPFVFLVLLLQWSFTLWICCSHCKTIPLGFNPPSLIDPPFEHIDTRGSFMLASLRYFSGMVKWNSLFLSLNTMKCSLSFAYSVPLFLK